MKRYVLEAGKENIENTFDVRSDTQSLFEPNYNVIPGTSMPIIVNGENEREVVRSIWGISEGEDAAEAYRHEDIQKDKNLQKMVKRDPCIIPISGFYKWKDTVKDPLPFYLRVLIGEVTAVAGVCQTITNKSGLQTYTHVVLTMPANPLVEPLDDRMPVVLNQSQWKDWLAGKAYEMTKKGFSGNALLPDMSVYRVPELVNDPANNTKELVQPIPKLRNYEGEEE